ncbi:DAGKc domain-containing protein [Planctomycetales bacterium 10988]|nr:DAGKc domain-containing protein [Planctomycetales bacterium 10988]
MQPSVFQLDESADSILVARNPHAGTGKRAATLDALVEALRQEGWRVEICTDLDQIGKQAEDWHQAGRLRALLAAGGDGTVAELLNRTSPGITILPYPMGTENLLSKYLGLMGTTDDWLEVIREGHVARLDAGRAGDRLFLLMLSCGLDAEIVRELHQRRQGHIHHLSYVKPSWLAMRNYQYPQFTIRYLPPQQAKQGELHSSEKPASKEEWKTLEAHWLFLFNLPCYGLGLQFVEEANPWDGAFDLCVFQGGSLTAGFRYLWQVFWRQHRQSPECKVVQARRLQIECTEPVAAQFDGDPGGTLPLEIATVPQRFQCMVPRGWLQRQHGLAAVLQQESSAPESLK